MKKTNCISLFFTIFLHEFGIGFYMVLIAYPQGGELHEVAVEYDKRMENRELYKE